MLDRLVLKFVQSRTWKVDPLNNCGFRRLLTSDKTSSIKFVQNMRARFSSTPDIYDELQYKCDGGFKRVPYIVNDNEIRFYSENGLVRFVKAFNLKIDCSELDKRIKQKLSEYEALIKLKSSLEAE